MFSFLVWILLFLSCLHPQLQNHRQPQLISVMCRITPYGNAIARGIKLVRFPNLGFHRLFSCRSCCMLTLNRNIHKSFGSSSECLWNVMQKWLADLWHSSISGKEKEPAANIIWLLVHHYVFLAATISLFSFPLIPPGVRHFTMEPNRRSISFSLHFSYRFLTFGIHFKGRKIICWVAWRHPSFVINLILPPKTPETPQNQRIMGWLRNTSG